MRTKLEVLYERLEIARLDIKLKKHDLDLPPLSKKHYAWYQEKYNEAAARERLITRQIHELEACEHTEYEEALVDHHIWHRVCLDCGKVADIETKDVPW